MGQICFDSSAFYTVMCVGFTVIAYVIITIYQDNLLEARKFYRRVPRSQARTAEPTAGQIYLSTQLAAKVQRLEDMQRMMDPLTPPNRRGPFDHAGYSVGTSLVGIPTRGEYGSFQQLGYIYNGDDVKQTMPLVGRRIHSNQYEYYTFHHYNPALKIPITVQSNKELNDGDAVTLTGYPSQFKTKLYDLDAPRYMP